MSEKSQKVIPEKAIGSKVLGPQYEITEKEALLYAVGIGLNLDPLKEQDYKFTNQFNDEFTVFPTITSSMRTRLGFELICSCPYIPNFSIGNLLHAEQKLFMVKPSVKIGVKYQNQFEIVDAQDKGKNAIITFRFTCFQKNEKGERQTVFYIDRAFFFRGMGGFGYKGNNSSPAISNLPERKPDQQFTIKTYSNQAFVYRLIQDPNPLHIDPNMAAVAGFQKPILHGLATYGTVARGLAQNLLNNNTILIQSYQVKFIGHVFPGETLSIKVWNDGNKKYFAVEVVERQKKVVMGALTVREQAKL